MNNAALSIQQKQLYTLVYLSPFSWMQCRSVQEARLVCLYMSNTHALRVQLSKNYDFSGIVFQKTNKYCIHLT